MNKTDSKNAIKKSIVLSGLVSTGGLFISKLIGLFYTIPFSYLLASDAWTSIYGYAYQIYSYILNIFTAGFPFAISTLVAQYSAKNDAKTILKIKRIALRFLALLGIAGMILMMLLAFLISPVMMPEQPGVMRNALLLLSLALALVPLLSGYRGVIQGRREMTEYAFSQTYEQLFRVGFLLTAACLVVYVFHMDRVWALYCAVLSTAIAAGAGLWQIIRFYRHNCRDIEYQARRQRGAGHPEKALLREFFSLAIPYLVVAVFGYSDSLFNSFLLPIGLNMSGLSEAQRNAAAMAMNFTGTKLTAIPMILAPGFTAALIPHIAAARTENNRRLVRQNVLDCLNIVFFVAIPVSFCIFLYARPICNTLFYTEDLEMATLVTQWIALEGFFGTVSPLVTNIMMALGLRRSALKRLCWSTALKAVLMIPFMMWWGVPGTVISTVIAHLYMTVGNLAEVARAWKIPWRGTVRRLLLTCGCTLLMWGCAALLNRFGLNGGLPGSTPLNFLKMAANGVLSLAVFALAAWMLYLPQAVFHIRSLGGLLRRKNHA